MAQLEAQFRVSWTFKEHIQSEISRALFNQNYRIDIDLLHSKNRKVAENREVLKVIINVLIFVTRQNIALRGHRKNISSNNSNFLELLKLMSQYNPTLI